MWYVVRHGKKGKFREAIFKEVPLGFPAGDAMRPREVPLMARPLFWKNTWKLLQDRICMTQEEFLTALTEVCECGWHEGVAQPRGDLADVPLESVEAGPWATKLILVLQESSHWEVQVCYRDELRMLTPRRMLNALSDLRKDARDYARCEQRSAA